MASQRPQSNSAVRGPFPSVFWGSGSVLAAGAVSGTPHCSLCHRGASQVLLSGPERFFYDKSS